METQPKSYEHLSSDIYEWMERKDAWGANEAQRLIKQKIAHDREIMADKPLERILAIVEKHKEQALRRKIDLGGLNAYDNDEDGYRIIGQFSPEYQAFTREMLEAQDFAYTSQEASLVGAYQREHNGEYTTDIIIDRILLRKVLSEVKDPTMRENIWYVITLNNNNQGAVKYLREKHGDEATNVIGEMETTVLPAYVQFLDDMKKTLITGHDKGISINAGIADLRVGFIKSIVEWDYHLIQKSRKYREIRMKRAEQARAVEQELNSK